ncbi:zinc finger protein AEBP2 isoform X1 [Osmerus eperlanus]|uniref:zinc finger protein AEBP2 isoform X1 n=1 Tax=Osmerus eperlanus TaxID=29151 RepID=UPI002E1358C2
MATISTEESAVQNEKSNKRLAGETKEDDKTGLQTSPEQPANIVEMKTEEADGMAGEVKPAEEALVVAVAATTGCEDEEQLVPEFDKEDKNILEQHSPADCDATVDNAVKEMKLEQGDESQSSISDCMKSKAASNDGAEEKSGTRSMELGNKRRTSVEMSSSDGEPLSRMDSEDSISSTMMDMESTVSSGRSTPAMMNGQGSATSSSSSAKAMAYSCCWDLCLETFSCSPDLAEHIRGIHVDGQRGGVFVCLWKGCKVYNTPSTSQSWLQRHMLTHSGDKPFKCVVGGCNASFASQGGLARHVPTHFSQQSASKLANQAKLKEESPSKAGLSKRKKLKNKRRRSLLSPLPPARPHDFFDAQTMDAIRHRAICLNLATHIETVGNGHSIVFHSSVLARRKEGTGKVKVLLHWTPEDILPDVWVNETERSQLKTKVVHLSALPQDTAVLLDPNIYRALPQKRLKRSL